MQRKEQVRKAAVVFLIIGAGVLGIMSGVVLFMTNPDLIPLPMPTPATSTPLPVVQLPTNTPTTSWVVTYEHRFSPDLMTAGSHSYTIAVNCPGEFGSGTYSGSFSITDEAPLQQNRVYVRPTGIWDSASGGNRLSVVNSDQAVGAAVSLRYDTLDQAEGARVNCDVTVELDSSNQAQMEPALPREE